MTALTLALVAGLAVGSDRTERISTEAKQPFLGNGYWEGIGHRPGIDGDEIQTATVKIQPGLVIEGEKKFSCQWIDEGRGRCRLIHVEFDPPLSLEGIYKQEAGQLIICLGQSGDRPTRFHRDQTHGLIILYRAKPLKK